MRFLLLGLALCISACSSASGAKSAVRSSAGRDFACRECNLPIDNVAKMSEGVYRGGQPDRAGLRALKANGFKTVVNLRQNHSERKDAEALGLKVYELPIYAGVFGCDAPTKALIEEFLRVVTDPANQPVFFHCAHGCDRTGTMAAIYRMEVDGWTKKEAIEEMHAFGYHTIYKDLIDCVECYECEKKPAAPQAAGATSAR
jgi:tyrosine-protein phosphatase SIW14